MTLGQRIRQLREENNMSAEELATILGVNRATIFRYESDEIRKFPSGILVPLAKALNTTPQYIMGWTNEKSDQQKSAPKSERNVVKIAGRDGRYIEKHLTDEQINTLKQMIEALPDVPDDL